MISPGGAGAKGENAYSGESHLWTSDLTSCRNVVGICWHGFGRRQMIGGEALRLVVDLGGKSAKSGSHAAIFNPDILILTHSDNDHIGGFVKFIAAQPDRLREVWVPYEWGLLVQAYAGLVGNLRAKYGRQTTPDDLRGLGQLDTDEARYPPSVVTERLTGENFHESTVDVEVILEVLGIGQEPTLEHPSDILVKDAISEAIDKEREDNPDWPLVPSPEKSEEVAADLAAKSAQLRFIVETTLRLGVRVRFFSTDAVDSSPPWVSAGSPGLATLVNAVEVFFVRSTQVDPARNLYLAARLTAQNRRALAPFLWDAGCIKVLDQILEKDIDFWDERDLSHPLKPWGVLIWSDGAGESAKVSGAAGVTTDFVPWEHTALMTAPHHASATVDHQRIWKARAEFCRIVGREIPVLSAGGNMLNMATEYEHDLPASLRACTRCRHLQEKPSKTVVAVIDGPNSHLTHTCRK